MPRLAREDGVEIHWEQRGAGPLVVLAGYWSMHPSALDPLAAELGRDHRVLRYDDRGSGDSTRRGPYDAETGAGDLAAVIEAAGGAAVAVAIADGTNRAVRVAARRPELIEALVAIGTAPIGRVAIAGSEALASSRSVVAALERQIETDYRGALRGLLASANEQMSADELRQRVQDQVTYTPAEVALERMHAYGADDPIEFGQALAGRLWVLVSETVAGGWLPSGEEMVAITAEMFPQAHLERIDRGIVSDPAQVAGIIRGITRGSRP